MASIENCPYCGRVLTVGKTGNSRKCMLCGITLCSRCMIHGICAEHEKELNANQMKLVAKTYRNYNLSMCSGVIGLIFGIIVIFSLILPPFESSEMILVLIIIIIGMLMMVGIFLIIKKTEKIFSSKIQKIHKHKLQ